MATNASIAAKPKARSAVVAPDAHRGKEGVVLITGSSGFLGRAIIGGLSERFDIVGLDFDTPRAAQPDYEAIRIDLSSDQSVKSALERVRAGHGDEIAAVIHLAAYYDLSGEPNPMYERVTVKGTERLIGALQGFKVDQFILASTMLVHAPAEPGHKIDEDAALAPQSPYPQSKVDAERAAVARHGDIPLVILRLAGVYDNMCRAAFLAEQIAAIFEKRFTSRVFPGELDRGQPYLHVDDLVDAIQRLVDRRTRLTGETTLLLSEPDTPSYGLLQARIGELLYGEAWETRKIPKPVAMAGQFLQEQVFDLDPFVQPWMISQAGDHYEIDISRAEALLDWRPRRRLIDTLPDIIAKLKRDPKAWYEANKLNPARVAPFALSGESVAAALASVVMGAALIALSLPRGRLSGEHYGGWDRWIV